MSVEHRSRRGQTWYLHVKTTATGKDSYFFSMNADGQLVEAVPDGYEIYENANSQVFLRKRTVQVIQPTELAIVEDALRKHEDPWRHWVEAKKDTVAERFCFRGSVDDWIPIGGPAVLSAHVRQFVKHLGRESFYELF